MRSEVAPRFVRLYFAYIAALTSLIGTTIILWPSVTSLFFDQLDPPSIFFVRILGSTLIGFAILNYITSHHNDGLLYRAAAYANAATLTVATIICVVYLDQIDHRGWILVAQHALFAIGFYDCIYMLERVKVKK